MSCGGFQSASMTVVKWSTKPVSKETGLSGPAELDPDGFHHLIVVSILQTGSHRRVSDRKETVSLDQFLRQLSG